MFGLGRIFRWCLYLGLTGLFLGVMAVLGAYYYLEPQLPSIASLKDVRLQVPLRVYTRDGKLIQEFGEKKRAPLQLEDVPLTVVNAVIASEDEHFWEHPGVDWQGLARAVIHLLKTGEKGPGGSTITMQVARNFFFGREKTYERKAKEILLALKIERELSKQEILELYLNKIFLGQRAYGVGAAAQVYYGKHISELSLAQIAMIAGLPQAPSRFNPIASPELALARRAYVLRRLNELLLIDGATYQRALNAPVTAERHDLPVEVSAPYVAEMVRAEMESRYDDATSAGYSVYTSIDSKLQVAANNAIRDGLIAYDQRHGYRGPEYQIDLGQPELDMDSVLKDIPTFGGLLPALVTEVSETFAKVHTRRHGQVQIDFESMKWARAYRSENRRGEEPGFATDVVQPGDVVRIAQADNGWVFSQVPDVDGALVSVDPADGGIRALTGGFDFNRSKFNRVTQAQRQPGSSFKPFIYSSALEHGYTAATLINDAPVVFDDPGIEDEWRPENYSGKFFGPTRMRFALTKSRNLVSIRVLRDIGVDKALEHIARFGLDADRLPRNLSLALGSGTVTPLEMAKGYAVLANGGFQVEPYFIDRIDDWRGRNLFEMQPQRVCTECETEAPEPMMVDDASAKLQLASNADGIDIASFAATVEVPAASDTVEDEESSSDSPVAPFKVAPRTVDGRNVYIMNSMLRDVVRHGTGRKAMSLGRNDLAGKTGTTNDQRDAWFSGFNPALVTTAWVGFDLLQPLGRRETGGRAALPIWISFMGEALEGTPDLFLEEPDGLVSVRIDPETGQLAPPGFEGAVFEMFRAEHVPGGGVVPVDDGGGQDPFLNDTDSASDVTEQLF